jgi:hypothetical protein
MLSVWVESRSSPNLAQVGGRVWGYVGCEGQQEHHLYTCTNSTYTVPLLSLSGASY